MKTLVGKVVVLGSQGVGKTCTVIRYVENSFSQSISPTVGATFFSCNLFIDEVMVKLQVWDTAGQERFKAMAPMFYRNANAALLIFDITSYASFEKMKGWVQELHKNVDETIVLCVVGNKIDLQNEREFYFFLKVSRDEAKQYASSIGATYHEASAKTDQGIAMIFDSIAHGLLRMTGQGVKHTVKVYNDVEDLMARSSELEATDTAVEETVNLSINSIAHGNSVKSGCC